MPRADGRESGNRPAGCPRTGHLTIERFFSRRCLRQRRRAPDGSTSPDRPPTGPPLTENGNLTMGRFFQDHSRRSSHKHEPRPISRENAADGGAAHRSSPLGRLRRGACPHRFALGHNPFSMIPGGQPPAGRGACVAVFWAPCIPPPGHPPWTRWASDVRLRIGDTSARHTLRHSLEHRARRPGSRHLNPIVPRPPGPGPRPWSMMPAAPTPPAHPQTPRTESPPRSPPPPSRPPSEGSRSRSTSTTSSASSGITTTSNRICGTAGRPTFSSDFPAP